ncbi:MAG: 2-C-methyl-D-erythritol 4-phosphate cytidylyltransferase, partial [Gemmatimonadota bacterium]
MAIYSVIIPAAGKGERFSDREKKTFAKIDNRPVFIRTLERFVARKDVCQTLLVVAPDDIDMAKTKYGPNLSFMGVKIVEGGARRCDGVASALEQLSQDA